MGKWWENAVIYQIYPKSFQDSNGDGIGDIQGMIQRLDYLKELGIDAVWLNPIFLSPQVDNGYDISDYYQIDPVFGTEKELERFIQEAHRRNIKVIFDLVMNHTSDQHPWFQEAIKGPDNPFREYYLWEKPTENHEVPNNWASFFGGSVWEKEPEGDEFYFHLFAKEMPDLNWENPKVRQEILEIACYWAEKGVDGWRLDAFIHVDKADFSNQVVGVEQGELSIAEEYYANLPKVQTYLHEFSSELKARYPEMFIVGEAASATVELAKQYTDPNPEKIACDTVITFRYFPEDQTKKDPRIPFDRQPGTLNWPAFEQVMDEWQKEMGQDRYPTLYWNNHDMPRMVSRFGDDQEYRTQSQTMLACLMYLQKGLPFMLFGEEIGMKNLVIDDLNGYNDPQAKDFFQQAIVQGYSEEAALTMLNATTKDASRGVMQWNDQAYSGFSTVAPWSGVNNEADYHVAAQFAHPESIFHFYQRMIALKHLPLFQKGAFIRQHYGAGIYSYRREFEGEKAIVICNTGNKKTDVMCEFEVTKTDILLRNQEILLKNNQTIELPAYGAIVLKLKEN